MEGRREGMVTKGSGDLQDGSVSKDACIQAGQPEFLPWDSHDRGQNWIPQLSQDYQMFSLFLCLLLPLSSPFYLSFLLLFFLPCSIIESRVWWHVDGWDGLKATRTGELTRLLAIYGIGLASQGRARELTLVVEAQGQLVAEQLSYHPGLHPGFWVGAPQNLLQLWTGGAYERTGQILQIRTGRLSVTQCKNRISERCPGEELVLIV